MYGTLVAPTISDTRRETSYGPTLGQLFDLLQHVGAEDGALPAYAWPGGYPILYLDGSTDTLCAACANLYLDGIADDPQCAPITGDVYWEGPDEHCAQCGTAIPSAYGDPEADAS